MNNYKDFFENIDDDYDMPLQDRDVIWICSLVTLWKIALAVGSVFTNCCYQPSLSLSSDDDADDADDDGGCDKNIVYNCFCLLSLAKEISSSSLFVNFCFYIF